MSTDPNNERTQITNAEHVIRKVTLNKYIPLFPDYFSRNWLTEMKHDIFNFDLLDVSFIMLTI